MTPRFAVLVALALAFTTTASAGPLKKKAILDKPTTGTSAPPPPAPVAAVAPKSAPADPCAQVLQVPLHSVVPITVPFARLAGPAATRLADAKKVTTSIEVEVTASKRRLFVEIDGRITSHDPSGGQTGYRVRERSPRQLGLPAGCEIASIANAKGWISDTGPSAPGTVKLLGTGLVDSAKCTYEAPDTDDAPQPYPRCALTLGMVEVKLRPAEATCAAFTLQPEHIRSPELLKLEAGDGDLDGDRVNLDLRTTVIASAGRIDVQTTLSLEQAGDDQTLFYGKEKKELFVAAEDAPGCRLKNAFKTEGKIRLTTPAHTDAGPEIYKPSSGTGGGLLVAWCNTDRPGPDTEFDGSSNSRSLVCGNLEFDPIVVELEPDTGGKSKSKWIKKIAAQ